MAEKDSKVYHRDRPVLNIGTIGHVDHGKTTLTAALTKIAAETHGGSSFVPYDRIDKAPEERARGITINTSHVHYNTSKYFCSHTDCPGHADYVKNMIAGAAQMDAAILVVASTDSVMPQTKEHLMLAKQVGVKHVAVYLNKCDIADPDLIEISIAEIRDELSKHGFDGDNVPIVEGSALSALEGNDDALGKQSILKLMSVIDEFPLPERAVDGDFLMPIEGIFSIPGRGTVVTGKVDRGRINIGNEVEIVGLVPTQKSICTGVEMYKKQVNDAQAGDNIGVLLRGIERNNVIKGQVLAKPGTIVSYSVFKARMFISKTEDGGRHTPFASGYRPQFFVRTTDVTGTIFLPKGCDILMPGENVEACIKLLSPIAMSEGLSFAIREGGKTVGAGKVVELLKDDFPIGDGYNVNVKDSK